MAKYICLCCGNRTLDSRGEYDICPVCFWEDDAGLLISQGLFAGKHDRSGYDLKDAEIEKLLDVGSGANHGLTLREGRANYHSFGACEEAALTYVRKPLPKEVCEQSGQY